MPKRVLITDPIAEEGIEKLRAHGLEVDLKPDLKGDALVQGIQGYHVLIVRSATKVTRAVIEAADVLEIIGRAGVGLDNIDLEAAKERGLKVLNTPGATAISVAELTLGLILGCLRAIPYLDRALRTGRWEKKRKGIELYGKTVGIIGLGRIGSEVAKRLQAFGAKVLAYDPYAKDSPWAKRVDLETLLRNADIITLHVPLTPETRHLINADQIRQMKNGAILINTARGGIVDEQALYDALVSGKLRAAALDVYETEPLPEDHPLRSLDQAILTPHTGAQTEEGQIRAAVELADRILQELS